MPTKTTKSTKATVSKSRKAKTAAKGTGASSQLIDFTGAIVLPGIKPKSYYLLVWGKKPYTNMHVQLDALIYVQQPDYWGIEVRGSMSGVGPALMTPYFIFKSLDGILGKKGIEVIGKTKKKKINVP